METHPLSFGEVNFSQAQLGDARRTKRLVKSVDLMCRRPGGTLPQKFNNPKDLRAFYRLMDCDEVTHEAILSTHRVVVLKKILESGITVLNICDSTEMDYTTHESLNELGQIGNGNHRGYVVQNCVAVDAETGGVVGLCNQVLHHRDRVGKKETQAQKRERESRESRLWLKGVEPLPASWSFVDVCDQGADTFEFLEHETHSGRRFLIRSAYDRCIFVGHDEPSLCESEYLRSYAAELPPAGHWTLEVTSRVNVKSPKKKGAKVTQKRSARMANMAVAFAPVQIRPPKEKHGNHGLTPLKVWIVRVWEVDPPEGEERLEWFLVTNEPIQSVDDAHRVVGWYERRWIIEEYHKGLKTGLNIESPQFTTEDRLQPAIAVLSVVALTLLEMRDASRRVDAKTRKATEIICEDYVTILSVCRHGKPRRDWSIHDFYYALARLGGHQNRKSDHPPGWQTIWRGWNELQAMLYGADAMKILKECSSS